MAADTGDDQARAHARRPSSRDSRTARASDRRPKVSAASAMRRAAEQLEELLGGREPESVSAVKPTSEGWEADVEVVELERVPDTASVMASYRVTLDEEGELMAYERIRRYTRAQIDRL